MHENDIVTLDIEKFSNLGYGITKVDGYVIFVEGACPGDIVSAKITKANKNFAQAKTLEVLTPSKNRVEPFCPMQKVCGACQLQFIDYDYQLELKRQIVEDAIRTIGGLDAEIPKPIASPEIKNYRHKIQYPVSETKVSKRILAGYYKPQTHEIVNLKHCPIQPEICDKVMDFIREHAFDFGISGFNEKKHSGDLRHVVIRSSADSGRLLVTLVVNATKTFERLNKFAKAIFDEFDEVSGVCVNFNSKKTNVILGKKSECIAGVDFIEEKLLEKTFKIGPNTFFQVNPKSAENIFKYVKDFIRKNYKKPLVLDAYAGISTFGICVSDTAEKVVTVEENPESCEQARESLKINKVKNVEIHNSDAAEFFKNEKRRFDLTIIDPPRKGCSEESLNEVFRLTKGHIVYVSCNPATLARDLKILITKGCRVESIQPFDMFCHTYHVENVAIIKVPQ